MSNKISILIFWCTFSLFAQTHIQGDLTEITLNDSNKIYIVDEDIFVPEQKKVTIPEGSVFLVSPFCGLQISGNLNVNGTIENPVVFTSLHDSLYTSNEQVFANPFDWNGILALPSSGIVCLQYVEIRYSVYGLKSQNSQIILRHGVFRQNGQFHFSIDQKILPVVENFPFSYNAELIPPAAAPIATVAVNPAIPVPITSTPPVNDIVKDSLRNQPVPEKTAIPVKPVEKKRTVKIGKVVSLGVCGALILAGGAFAWNNYDLMKKKQVLYDASRNTTEATDLGNEMNQKSDFRFIGLGVAAAGTLAGITIIILF